MRVLRPLLAAALLLPGAVPSRASGIYEYLDGAGKKRSAEARKKAVDRLIDAVAPYLGPDAPDAKQLSTEEKAAFLRLKAESEVKKAAAKKAKAALGKQFNEYLKQSLEAKAVRDIAIPQMLHTLSTGNKYDAALLDSRVASEVDTRMSALGGLWEGAVLSYEAVTATAKGGAYAGAQVVGGAVSEKLLDALLPQWKLVQLGSTLVISYARYILSYANETAKEAIFNDLYPDYRGNPEVFANWLLKQSNPSLRQSVEDRWAADDPDFAAYLWEGKGTESGAGRMRERLAQTLFDMRRDLMERTAKTRRVQRELQRRIDAAAEKTKSCDAALRRSAQEAADAVAPILRQLDEFNEVKSKASPVAQEAEDVGAWYAESRAPGYGPPAFRPLGLKFEDLQGKLDQLVLREDGDLGPVHDAVAADLDAQEKAYAGEHGSQKAAYDRDCLGEMSYEQGEALRKAWSTYAAALGGMQELTRKQAYQLDVEIDAYAGLLKRRSKEALAAYRKRAKYLTGVLLDFQRRAQPPADVTGQPRDYRYDGISSFKLKGSLPEPRFRGAGDPPLFGAFVEQLKEALTSLSSLQRDVQDRISAIDEALAAIDQAKETLAAVAVLEREVDALDLEVLQDDALTKADRLQWDPILGEGPTRAAKAVPTEVRKALAHLSQSRSVYEDQKRSRRTAIDEMQRDIDSLRKYVIGLNKGDEILRDAARRYTKAPTRDFSSGCGPELPGEHFFFDGTPACPALVTGAVRPMDAAAQGAARGRIAAQLAASGVYEADRRFRLGIERFAAALLTDFFSQAAVPDSHLFLPYEKRCCCIPTAYLEKEAKAIRSLPLATATDGDEFKGRMVSSLEFSAVYTLSDFRLNPDKPKVEEVLAAAKGAFDAAAAAALSKMTAAMQEKAKLYAEYLRKEKVVAQVNAGLDALNAKVTEAVGEANAKNTKEAWAALAALESEYQEAEASYEAVRGKGDIPEERRSNIETKLAAAKSNIDSAKTASTGLPGTGAPALPPGIGKQPGGATPSKPEAPAAPAKPVIPAGPQTPPAGGPDGPPAEPATGSPFGGHRILVTPITSPSETQERNAANKVYAEFCAAYEAKSVSQVLKFIDNDWEAGDGTSISDLQASLSSTFRVFNDLKCTISNVKLTRIKAGRWRASYEMTIVGRIYAQNIKHEERSTVDEEIAVENGKAVISRTLKGNFWYFE